MRRTFPLLLILPALALPLAGCGDKGAASTPVACLSDTESWVNALLDPAGDRLLEGKAAIADCVPADQSAADQEEVGRIATDTAMVMTAMLKREAPRLKLTEDQAYGPGPLAVAEGLGYMVGSLQRAAEKSQGIHATLVDRVTSAATNNLDGYPPAVRAGFEKGREAGLETG